MEKEILIQMRGGVCENEHVFLDKKKEEMRKFLLPFFEGLTVSIDDRYPNSVFYEKDGETLFNLQHANNAKFFWVHYEKIWDVFQKRFKLTYLETMGFIKIQANDMLGLGEVAPVCSSPFQMFGWKIPNTTEK